MPPPGGGGGGGGIVPSPSQHACSLTASVMFSGVHDVKFAPIKSNANKYANFLMFKNFAKGWLSESSQISLNTILSDLYFSYFGKWESVS